MKLLRILINLTGLAVLIIASYIWIFFSSGTDVKYQSSDYGWADSEMLWKGRDFDSIVFYFHLYKEKCHKPNVVLQRLTDRPNWFEPEHWFNNYRDPKWQVPLAKGDENTNLGYYPRAFTKHCYNSSSSQELIEKVEKQSNDFVRRLSQNT
ncbi:hypothetical protein AADZ84_02585 [Colwelliaceae bacterium MEBiC 14330]